MDEVHENSDPYRRFAEIRRDGMSASSSPDNPIRIAFRQVAYRYLGSMRRRFVTNSAGGGDWPDLARSTKLGRARRSLDRRFGTFASVTSLQGEFGVREKHALLRIASLQRRLGNSRSLKEEQATRENLARAIIKLNRLRGTKVSDRAARGRAGRITSLDPSLGHFEILRDTGVLLNALTEGAPGNVVNNVQDGIEVGIGDTGTQPGTSLTLGRLASYHQNGEGRLPQRTIIVDPPDDDLAAMRGYYQRGLDRAAALAGDEHRPPGMST